MEVEAWEMSWGIKSCLEVKYSKSGGCRTCKVSNLGGNMNV